ncbi:hypothetical protein M758_UG165400 [Ceratodon purpureus]|nr:hypothetical protein M758_UG165400 [Ceratodon purpureus]
MSDEDRRELLIAAGGFSEEPQRKTTPGKLLNPTRYSFNFTSAVTYFTSLAHTTCTNLCCINSSGPTRLLLSSIDQGPRPKLENIPQNEESRGGRLHLIRCMHMLNIYKMFGDAAQSLWLGHCVYFCMELIFKRSSDKLELLQLK